MDYFAYAENELHAEGVPLSRLAAQFGTPLYVYSRGTLTRHCESLVGAFRDLQYPTLPCFAVKANSNLSVLKTVFAHGFGADVVSVGEMERALVAGVNPGSIVFSGVGKQEPEIQRGLEVGILSFNVESLGELDVIREVANRLGKVAPISLRINPNIDAKTHPHISTGLYSTKFGIAENDLGEAVAVVRRDKALRLLGIDCHIGSQITELSPFRDAARRMAQLARGLLDQGIPLEVINLGGGLGIRYRDESPPSLEAYAKTIVEEVRPTGLKLVLEPGRVMVGNAGGILTRVVGVKRTAQKNFVIIDAAMNDLIRPSLYDAYHEIVPVTAPAPAGSGKAAVEGMMTADVVGPICETGDFLGLGRALPSSLRRGDLLFIRSGGAYGATMASHYNSRPQAAEVLVDGESFRLVRPRERLDSLWASELEALKETI